jgi:hypothetical protein
MVATGGPTYATPGRRQWLCCDLHQTKWSIGWILTPESDASEWERNANRIAHYRVVEPVHTLDFELHDCD